VSVTRAEELLRLLPQVTGCRIRVDEQGAPVAVLITAAPGSNAKAVLADVITVLGAEAGLDVLEDQVHVVVLEEQPSPEAEHAADWTVEPLEREGRLRLLSYSTHVREERTAAQVELGLDREVAFGEAQSRGAGEVPELLGRACLDAIERFGHGRVALRLMSLRRATVGSIEAVIVVVQETWGREERLHVGAARIGDDFARSVAYAVLDSMNRRLGRILASAPEDYEID